MIPIIIYTHTDYQDIFNICIERHNKYSPNFEKIIFSNKLLNDTNINILYNDTIPYTERIYNSICKLPIQCEYIILTHDWSILYDYIDDAKINDAIQTMKNKDIHQIRLIHSGAGNIVYIDDPIIPLSNTSYLYSVQPTIWNINVLKQITYNNRELNYRNIELGVFEYMKQFNNYVYYEGEELFPNANHHKSNIFPHIHSTSRGKWILHENHPYIDNIIDEFSIDINIRGCIT